MQLVAVSTRRQTAASTVSAAIRSGLQPVRSLEFVHVIDASLLYVNARWTKSFILLAD